MIVLAVVLFVSLLAPSGRLAREFGRVIDAECRDTGMREREMIAAEVVSGLGRDSADWPILAA